MNTKMACVKKCAMSTWKNLHYTFVIRRLVEL